jgi:hypothetical protein
VRLSFCVPSRRGGGAPKRRNRSLCACTVAGARRLSARHKRRFLRPRAALATSASSCGSVERAPRARVVVPIGRSPEAPGCGVTSPARGRRIADVGLPRQRPVQAIPSSFASHENALLADRTHRNVYSPMVGVKAFLPIGPAPGSADAARSRGRDLRGLYCYPIKGGGVFCGPRPIRAIGKPMDAKRRKGTKPIAGEPAPRQRATSLATSREPARDRDNAPHDRGDAFAVFWEWWSEADERAYDKL